MTNQNNAAGPIGPEAAEQAAVRTVRNYLNACCMTDRSQIGNYLMKLASVGAVVMAQAEGSEAAAQRLEATAAWVRQKMPAEPARMEPLQ
ncbi:hypothetical protein A9G00_43815 [Achromobacter xylosoxidans]|uniref:hypothetical protein n=1 Tax=Achromobacter TaxID=222 RepID=UPI0007BF2032|nr:MULTISPECIES: hypothetical protein [Achromobacter]ODA18741.1 hypothetical protein A9G00_43815 [Achromobacter xylosoxidans]